MKEIILESVHHVRVPCLPPFPYSILKVLLTCHQELQELICVSLRIYASLSIETCRAWNQRHTSSI